MMKYTLLDMLDNFLKKLMGNDQLMGGKVLILLNTSEEAFTFTIDDLPKGDWRLIGNNKGINHVNGIKDKKKFTNLKGGKSHKIKIPALGLKIWVL